MGALCAYQVVYSSFSCFLCAWAYYFRPLQLFITLVGSFYLSHCLCCSVELCLSSFLKEVQLWAFYWSFPLPLGFPLSSNIPCLKLLILYLGVLHRISECWYSMCSVDFLIHWSAAIWGGIPFRLNPCGLCWAPLTYDFPWWRLSFSPINIKIFIQNQSSVYLFLFLEITP